jgi:hypothetical protein
MRALEIVRVTADRVRRFSGAYEEEANEAHKRLWRAALDDHRTAVRDARAAGYQPPEIHSAARLPRTGRFDREPATSEDAGTATITGASTRSA